MVLLQCSLTVHLHRPNSVWRAMIQSLNAFQVGRNRERFVQRKKTSTMKHDYRYSIYSIYIYQAIDGIRLKSCFDFDLKFLPSMGL